MGYLSGRKKIKGAEYVNQQRKAQGLDHVVIPVLDRDGRADLRLVNELRGPYGQMSWLEAAAFLWVVYAASKLGVPKWAVNHVITAMSIGRTVDAAMRADDERHHKNGDGP